MSKAVCWINGEVVPRENARISVFDHGLLYGDGVFEGIRFYNGRAFRLHPHLRRLQDSASAIKLTLPYSKEEIAHAISTIIAAYDEPNGYLRLLVTRGEGSLGLDPASCGRPNVIIIAHPINLVSERQQREGIRTIIASTRRLSGDSLDPRIKSLNYLNPILARIEANQAGVQEALLLNRSGHVTEGTADNIFIVRDGTLRTPRPSDGVLEGITRNVILELAQQLGISYQETQLTAYDLYTADECFLTGTGAEMIPVREIDGRTVRKCPGLMYQHLETHFRRLIEQETKKK
jgi:branched-chain amino acid aminotransferase